MHDAPQMGQLLAQARAGDRAALEQLLERLRLYLHLLVRPRLGGALAARVDSSDLVQESLVHVAGGLPQFQGTDVPQFLAWVGQIVARVVVSSGRHHGAQKRDRHREHGPEVLQGVADGGCSPQEQAARDEQTARLAAALERLPVAYREVIQARFFDGLPFADIAERCGRSTAAVRVLCLRAVERLRREMGEDS
jgi:RNA polymerase sigma-70 factor (ECF subfamily)